MATTPPYGESDQPAQDQPAQKWTGRATVSRPAPAEPAGSRQPSATAPPPPPTYPRAPVYGKKRLRPRWGRIALVGALALLLVAGIGGPRQRTCGSATSTTTSTAPTRSRRSPDRPPKLAEGSLNILLLGTDSRDPDAPIDQAGKWRTDTIMLMHIPASHDKAYLISLPARPVGARAGEPGRAVRQHDGEDQRRVRLGWRCR